MKILIPMAGAGSRFAEAGYKISKPAIPTYDKKTGEKIPMVVCAAKDLPGVAEYGSNIVFVLRNFHRTDGTEGAIRGYFPQANFIEVEELTEGQACTCMVAEKYEKITWIEAMRPESIMNISGSVTWLIPLVVMLVIYLVLIGVFYLSMKLSTVQ